MNMKMNKYFFLFLFFFLLALSLELGLECFAADTPQRQDKKSLILSDLSSPFTTDARYFILGGGVLSMIALMNNHALNKNISKKLHDTQPIGHLGKTGEVIGWGFLNGLYVLAFGAHGYMKDDKLSKERFEIMFMSSLYTTATTTFLKSLIHEKRPDRDYERDSFPSGHASAAFNFSTVVMMEHGMWWGAFAHTAATFIAFSRVHDGRHWPSDVIAGATIGAAYGYGVYWNRRNANKNFYFSLVPNFINQDYQLKLTYQFE